MSGGMTRLQVAQNILSSNEYRTDFIQGWYQKYLSRAASESEVSAWLGTFDSGGTDEQVDGQPTGSARREFHSLPTSNF